MARKSLKKSISVRLNIDDYNKVLAYSDASEIAMADLLRLGTKEYMEKHILTAKTN